MDGRKRQTDEWTDEFMDGMERRTEEWTDEWMGGMERRTEEWTVGNGWMEWSGERMNGRMESMFDSGMDGCLGEKRRKESILGGFFGGLSERTKKNFKKLGKVRKS